MRRRTFGAPRQDFVERGERFLVALERFEDDPVIDQRVGRSGLRLERGGDQAQAFDRAALLMPENAAQMQGIEIVRIGREQRIVDPRGFPEPALLVQRQRLLDGVGRAQRPRSRCLVMLGSPGGHFGRGQICCCNGEHSARPVTPHPMFLEHRPTWLIKGKGFSSTQVLTALGHTGAIPKAARHRSMSIGSIGSNTSFWQQDIAAADAVNNAMAAAEANLGKGLASIANSTALHRVNTQLSQEIQNVLSGNTGQPLSSTTASTTATQTIPVAATGTGTAALSTNTSLSLLGVLAGGKISVTAGMQTTIVYLDRNRHGRRSD